MNNLSRYVRRFCDLVLLRITLLTMEMSSASLAVDNVSLRWLFLLITCWKFPCALMAGIKHSYRIHKKIIAFSAKVSNVTYSCLLSIDNSDFKNEFQTLELAARSTHANQGDSHNVILHFVKNLYEKFRSKVIMKSVNPKEKKWNMSHGFLMLQCFSILILQNTQQMCKHIRGKIALRRTRRVFGNPITSKMFLCC